MDRALEIETLYTYEHTSAEEHLLLVRLVVIKALAHTREMPAVSDDLTQMFGSFLCDARRSKHSHH